MATLHHYNILAHSLFGSLALVVGVGPMLTVKGSRRHQQGGRWFLGLAAVTLGSAVLGLAVFNFRPFLAVIVLLSVYQAGSGYRALHLRATGPALADGLLAALFLGSGLVFLGLLPRIRLVWSPVVIYRTLGALLAITSYDLSRGFWRQQWRRGAWRNERIWKMMSTYAALLSAFTGTVRVAYQPYRQFLPSVLGALGAGAFMARAYYRPQPAAAPTPLAASHPTFL